MRVNEYEAFMGILCGTDFTAVSGNAPKLITWRYTFLKAGVTGDEDV